MRFSLLFFLCLYSLIAFLLDSNNHSLNGGRKIIAHNMLKKKKKQKEENVKSKRSFPNYIIKCYHIIIVFD